ncbi:hypothetical protein E3U23_06010 [Erythrobacter litoralis]|uniref:hypothetical protein n=1 Tax=Erythrobacter litoralis TaxID=39960 RepID=UPI0024358EBB|nr:hypothetical protein [Erythrobacter litoralis]MDG6078746.1 hypothetical protein [Erythrobacter litoralis]
MTSVPQAFQGIDGIQILCLVQADGVPADDSIRNQLCDRVAAAAGQGTELAVSTIALGDPAVLSQSKLTILVHGAIEGGDRAILTMRPYRPSAPGSDVLFGAMPRVASLSDEAGIKSAINASLDEILPWRAGIAGVRKLP